MGSSSVEDAANRLAAAVKSMNTYHKNRADKLESAIVPEPEINAIAEQRARNLIQYTPDTRDLTTGLDAIHYHHTEITMTLGGIASRSGSDVHIRVDSSTNVTATKTKFVMGEPIKLTLDDSVDSGIASLTMVAHSNGIYGEPFTVSFEFQRPYSLTPTILSPIDGEQNAATTIVFSANPYATVPNDYDSVISANWVVEDSQGRVIENNILNSDFYIYELQSPLDYDSDYTVKVRFRGSSLDWGEFSVARAFRTRIQTGPGTLFYREDGVTLKGIGGPIIDGYQIVVVPGSQRNFSRGGLFKIDTSLENVQNSNVDEALSGFDGCQLLIDNYSTVVDIKGNVGPVAVIEAKKLGEEFYIPTIKELEAIIAVKGAIDAADTTGGKTFQQIADNKIHSRTEYNDKYSWYLTANGGKGASSKNQYRYLLPIYRIRL